MKGWTIGAVAALLLLSIPAGLHSGQEVIAPFEQASWATPLRPLDVIVIAALEAHGLQPARPCSDHVFVRRVYLDVIGTLPTPAELRAFFRDSRPDRRGRLIDELLERPEFADYWTLKWCDLLRVKAEFPINLWPNAVQAYHRWIHDAIRENRPYNEFARDLLTSSGSNFRVPAVNFYRALQGHDPGAIADVVALSLMGVRTAHWSREQRDHLAAFFSRLAFKPTAEWKEEIVTMDPGPGGPLHLVFPDGKEVDIPPYHDPRRVFAHWLTDDKNPWFTRNIGNRVWSWFMGRGIIHEPDDIRPDNPPSNPGLLALLEKELVAADYDLRHLYRLILNSRTYQQSSIPRGSYEDAETWFACYPVRRLDAEVLIDALCRLGGPREHYESAIPEPFTYIPERRRSISLADGSITSPLLEMFGRPPRDTGLESERSNRITDAQRLHLINSGHVQRKIERSRLLHRLMAASRGNVTQLVRRTYLHILSRPPTPEEMDAVRKYAGDRMSRTMLTDLAWALVNSKEFLYRH